MARWPRNSAFHNNGRGVWAPAFARRRGKFARPRPQPFLNREPAAIGAFAGRDHAVAKSLGVTGFDCRSARFSPEHPPDGQFSSGLLHPLQERLSRARAALQGGYSRQCPCCEVVLFFEEASPDKNIKRAMSAARAGRKLLREEEAAAPRKTGAEARAPDLLTARRQSPRRSREPGHGTEVAAAAAFIATRASTSQALRATIAAGSHLQVRGRR